LIFLLDVVKSELFEQEIVFLVVAFLIAYSALVFLWWPWLLAIAVALAYSR